MWKFYNAHPKGLLVADCVKRAITLAAQMDYMEVQRELNRYKKITGAKEFNSNYNPHKYVENVLKGRKLSFPAEKGCSRMNGERFCAAFPKGRYILNMAGHWSCCIDGIIYDTWDCSEKCVYTAYDLTPEKPMKELTYRKSRPYGQTTYNVKICDTVGNITTDLVGVSAIFGYERCLKHLGYMEDTE